VVDPVNHPKLPVVHHHLLDLGSGGLRSDPLSALWVRIPILT
jgi:hypothetical protein